MNELEKETDRACDNKIIEVVRGTNKILKFCLSSEESKILLTLSDFILEITDDKCNMILSLKGLICKTPKSNYFVSFTIPHTITEKLSIDLLYNLKIYGIVEDKSFDEEVMDFEYYKNKNLKLFVKDKIFKI